MKAVEREGCGGREKRKRAVRREMVRTRRRKPASEAGFFAVADRVRQVAAKAVRRRGWGPKKEGESAEEVSWATTSRSEWAQQSEWLTKRSRWKMNAIGTEGLEVRRKMSERRLQGCGFTALKFGAVASSAPHRIA